MTTKHKYDDPIIEENNAVPKNVGEPLEKVTTYTLDTTAEIELLKADVKELKDGLAALKDRIGT